MTIRRTCLDGDAGDERTPKPTAKLIAAFDHEVARPRHPVVSQHGQVRYSRLEPNVDDVLLFFEARAVAVRADEAVGKINLYRIAPPRVGPHFGKTLRGDTRDARIEQRLIAIAAAQRWNRR